MSKCRMSKQKTTSEKQNLVQTKKLGLERTMNGLGKPFRKNPSKQSKKE